MERLGGIGRTCPFIQTWGLLPVLLLTSVVYLDSLSSAQTVCGELKTKPIRVEDAAGVIALRAALKCTGGDIVEAEWAGRVIVRAPIAVGEDTILSVTGQDDLAEVHGVGSGSNGIRLFEVHQGGSLTLTRLNLSGGSAAAGGAIYSQSSNLTLDNCVLDGNVATDGGGGAVWADDGNVTIVGGGFFVNNATRGGGAVYATNSRLVVQNGSKFQGNTAFAGGAIFCGSSHPGVDKLAVLCSIKDAEFVSNNASSEIQDGDHVSLSYEGGGATMFLLTNADIADSVFRENHADTFGGALHGGIDTNVSVDGCIFANNTSESYGGAISASSMTLGGGTQLAHNSATGDGGAVSGWDSSGLIVFNDVRCTNNSAWDGGGGCFYGEGRGVINDGSVMHDNAARHGGCIYAMEGSDIRITGGRFTCHCENGAFVYCGDGARVTITGGTMEGNVASRRAGGVYCDGNSNDGGGSTVNIEGGTFINNSALELGGVIAAWGGSVVTIAGGEFIDNTAKFYGGFAFIEEKASIACKNATIMRHYAGDQGGGIYGREAKWVNSSCNLIANTSPNGAAIYLTNVESATFEKHDVDANLASGGSVVYVAASSVIVKEVMFKSDVDLQEDSSNRAIQLDVDSRLNAERCIFDGWRGDTVIYNRNPTPGSLVLTSCNFSGSSAAMAVTSPGSDAQIRNAIIGSLTFETVADAENNSRALVDRALDCSDSYACGSGACVNSTLGVLCECLEDGECLHGGGELSLSLGSSPADVTFYPDPVSYKLVVSSAATGTTNAIWILHFESEELALDVVPSSGVLAPGSSVIVTVTGTPSTLDVGGGLLSSFNVTSVSSTSSDVTSNAQVNVSSAFYLCQAYEYADSTYGDCGDSFVCKACVTIDAADGVSCDVPGATLASLPIREGYWRPSKESLGVRACLLKEACVGATAVSSSDDYCDEGYRGPYCAVCAEGYGRSLMNTCHTCHGIKARLLITTCTLFSFMVVVLLVFAVIYLIGGLDAVYIVRQSAIRKLARMSKVSGSWYPALHKRGLKRTDSYEITKIVDLSPGFDSTSCMNRDNSGGGAEFDGLVTLHQCGRLGTERTPVRPLDAVVSTNDSTKLSSATGWGTPVIEATPTTRHTRLCSFAGTHVSKAEAASRRLEKEASGCVASTCCVIGKKINNRVQRLPLTKLKILLGVWQILAVVSSITGAQLPGCYALFLSWVHVLNFDLGYIVSASCVLPSVNFYQQLLATTLAPLVAAAVLAITYRIAKGRAGIGSAGVIAKRAARSRHLSAGLLLTFMVFTSTSSLVFNTFPCDDITGDGDSYLMADYSISCETQLHYFFRAYAGVMMLVYPIGIPALYAVVLWQHRGLLNPQSPTVVNYEANNPTERATTAGATTVDAVPSKADNTASKGRHEDDSSPLTSKELQEKVKARAEHPDLAPLMSLWKDFDPQWYYYEVIECGRRIFLTDVLVLIRPHTVTQAATGCIFAFFNLLVFELMRPHQDPADSFLYRLGCVLIFLTMFLAMLIKMDAAEEESRSAIGIYMVAFNILLILAVVWTVLRHMGDSSGDKNANTDRGNVTVTT